MWPGSVQTGFEPGAGGARGKEEGGPGPVTVKLQKKQNPKQPELQYSEKALSTVVGVTELE